MESSSEQHENGVVSFGSVGDARVTGYGKGIVMASDERISRDVENGGNDHMRLNGEVSRSRLADDPNLGTNLVSEVGELHAINLVVDLRQYSTKEANDIEFTKKYSTVASFKPAKIIQCVEDLAKDPFGITRSEISTMEAQLSSFSSWKGNPDGGLSPSKKMKCLSDLMTKSTHSFSEVEYTPKKRGRKRKNLELNRDEFLSIVRYSARNPFEKHHNLESLMKFSSDFRNYCMETKSQLREETEIQHGIRDSYWTDKIIELKPKKENSTSAIATALILKFTDLESVPSVSKMNEIFGRYGTLLEEETQVLKKKKCVKMVFERRCDAETAFSSSGKFSIFGPALVSYCLNFSPTPRKRGTAGRNQNKKGVKSVKEMLFED